MRTVVFVQRQELEFTGNLSPNALVLGDVDNDSVSYGNFLLFIRDLMMKLNNLIVQVCSPFQYHIVECGVPVARNCLPMIQGSGY